MLLILLPIVFCLLPISGVEALTITGISVTLTCTSFTYTDFSYTFDRDNTGTGQEAYQIIVTDSDNNVVHLVSNTAGLGGPSSEGGNTGSFNLGTAVAGALTYKWVSLAGNGLEEQIAYSVTGFCGDAPTATPTSTPTPTATFTPSPTATSTPTPGPSPTLTPSITPTANYVVRSTVVYGDDQTQDVALVYQITAGDVAITLMLAAIFAALLLMMFLQIRRSA